MIEKRIELTYDDPNSDNFYQFITGHEDLTKTASDTDKQIVDFINNLELDTDKYVYVLINAMGAQEFYGDNNNGDAFPEYLNGEANLVAEGEDYGYKTFETNANLFKHHKNNDPKKRYGEVLLAVYNWKMHRPELVVRIDRKKAPKAAEKADNGEIIATSMGAKVPYDICSICGKKARSVKAYCPHLEKRMGDVLESGEKVFAINPKPKFFDISMVFVPADSTSRVMKKLAGKKTAKKKVAAIKKEIPGGPPAATGPQDIVNSLIARKLSRMKDKEPAIPRKILDDISGNSLESILSTMAFSGIVPKPKEFQRIILKKMNKSKMADMLEDTNISFNPDIFDGESDVCRSVKISPEFLDNSLFSKLNEIMPYRSVLQPHLLRRLSDKNMLFDNVEKSTPMNLNPLLSAISGMYKSYMDKAPKSLYSSIGSMLANTGQAKPKMGRIVISISGPGNTRNYGGVGDFLSKLLANRFASKNRVAFSSIDKLHYFLSRLMGDMPKSKMAKEASKSYIGLPLMAFGYDNGLQLIKAASKRPELTTRECPGRNWIVEKLSNNDSGVFGKEASDNLLIKNINPETVDLIHSDGGLLDVITLAKLAELS